MTESHLDLLCDVGQLSAALAGSTDIEHFLFRLCEVVATHMKAEVCSIYLLDEGSRDLVMRATVGLDPSSVGAIKLGEGEGLIGTSLKELRPVLDNAASSNPRYRFFPSSGEKNFDAFLAIPIIRGIEKIGVLAVQRVKEQPFGKDDLKALRAVASQLAGTVENSRAFMSLAELAEPRPPETSSPIRGKCVSGEYARGRLHHFGRSGHSLKSTVGKLTRSLTSSDLERALSKTAAEIRKIQEEVADRVPEAASLVFDAHLLMLKDRRFGGAMLNKVREGCEVGRAVLEIAGTFMDRFSDSPHAYLREKAADVEDIALRIVENLESGSRLDASPEGRPIYIAAALLPSDVVLLSSEGAAGVVLAHGGEMTHVTILAQSLDLPLFIAEEPSLFNLPEGTDVLLDGATGNIYIDPSKQIVELFEAERETAHPETGEGAATGSSKDLKEKGVRLLVNVNLLRDAPLAVKFGAEGVGLYRTEFPFLIRSSFPSEDEQYHVYCRLLKDMAGRPVTFRTLDVGGEKALAYYDHSGEENPELGLRSIRFSLRHRDIFTVQIRAILRAASIGPLKIMFPMISSLDEYREARGIVEECRQELEAEIGEAAKAPPLGIMIEVPSIVAVIEEAAHEADFLSVGTNDLVQYLLAADRGNEKVSDYFCLPHPAVPRTLAEVAAAAERAGKEITVCGEMAHLERFVPFLFGVGLRSLSVAPRYLPRLHGILSGLSPSAAKQHAARLLKAVTINEAAEVISSFNQS